MYTRNVLITQRACKDKYNNDIDVLECGYVEFFEKFGIRLIIISNFTKRLEEYFDLDISGVVLSGGNDIESGMYGGDAEKSSNVSSKRDACEKKILNIAINRRIPVFGICRGFQFINIYFGGKLNQEIFKKCGGKLHSSGKHNIVLEEDIMEGLESKIFATNSFHNQGVFIEDISTELNTFAQEKATRLVEGIYHKKLPIAAVQWHPERENYINPIDKVLVESFLERRLFWQSDREKN